MAVEQVVIKLTTTGNTREIRKARNDLLKLAAAGQLNDITQKQLWRQFDAMDKKAKKFRKTIDGLGKGLMSMNKIALKLFSIGFGVGAAALASVNALFAVGRVIAQAYKIVMQGLAAVVAAVGAGLATAAAAMREYSAATYAYAYKTSPALNNRLSESRASLRMLQDDAVLASFGMKALNEAFAAISKNSQVTGQSKNLLKGLADFAAAGGDPAKNLAAAAEFVGLLQKSGKLDQKALAAAEKVGPTLVEALKKAKTQGITTIGDLAKALQSGELAKLGGVEGQAGIVAGTIMGQFKAMFTELQLTAGDFGQALLGPTKKAMQEIGILVKRLFARIGPEMIGFGKGGLLGGLVSAFEKLEDFSVNLFRKYLPGSNGMMARFVDFWNKAVFAYQSFVNGLKKLLPLGKAVITAFGEPLKLIFTNTYTTLVYLGESIRKNQDKYNKFGKTLADLINKLQSIAYVFIDNFTNALPIIEKLVTGITSAVDIVLNLANAIGVVGGAIANVLTLGNAGGMGGFLSMISMLLFGAGLRGFSKNIKAGMPATQAARQAMPFGIGRGGQGGKGPVYGPPAPMPGRIGRGIKNIPARMKAAPGAIRAGAPKFFSSSGFMGGMGPAMLMGIGSMFADKTAQPSLQTGAAIAMLAPILGPAAAFAGMGVGGIGTMMNARTAKGGALGGALGGAGVGGMIGMALAPITGPLGPLVGAVIGAALGSVVGYFKGRSNADKNEAKKAGQEYMNTVYGGLSRSFFKGEQASARRQIETAKNRIEKMRRINEEYFQGTKIDPQTGLPVNMHDRDTRKRTAKMLVEQGMLTPAEAEAMAAAPGTYVDKLQEGAKALDGLSSKLDRFDALAKVAQKSFGMSADELERMANEAGVNLYNTSLSLVDVLKQLGLAAQFTAQQIYGSLRDIQVKGLEGMQNRVKIAQSGEALNELTEGIFKMAQDGPIELDALSSFLQDFINLLNVRNPNAVFRNMQLLEVLFGPGGAAFKPGQQLEGLESTFAPIQGILATTASETYAGGRAQLQDIITRELLFSGIGVDQAQLQTIIGKMDPAALDRLATDLASGALKEGNLLAGRGTYARRQSVFKDLGLGALDFQSVDVAAMSMEQQLALFGEEGVAVMKGMDNVIQAAFKNKPDWMVTPPDWFSKEAFFQLVDSDGDGKVGPDTSTPRGDTTSQRLGRTLRRHNYLNSMFAGKRNITSAYRTNMLGSINSDHIMGRAYDLTGDNLGAYATTVNKMGGFAEFHGSGGSRHLHVVPGETPMGDSTVPYSGVSSMAGPSSNVSNSYNIVVNGTPGMDVKQLADAVMERIKRAERDQYERS